MTTVVLMNEQAAIAAGEWKSAGDAGETGGIRSVHVGLLGVGAISATVRISGANDIRFPQTSVEFTLTGSNSTSDATELTFPWEFYRAEVIAISGVSARASAVMKV